MSQSESADGPEKKPPDEVVGYGKPPSKNQFKKGVSGNPKGRPLTKPLYQVVAEVLNEPISVTQGDEVVEMSRKEALVRQLVRKAMMGHNNSATDFLGLIKYMPTLGPL